MNVILTDKTSNANNFTVNSGVVGSLQRPPNLPGSGCADFDSTDYITAPDSASLSVSGTFTVECYLKQKAASGDRYIAQKWETAGNQRSFLFYIQDNDTLVMQTSSDGSTTTSKVSTATFASTDWFHIAVCLGGGNYEIVKDGTSVETGSGVDGSIFNSTALFKVFADSSAFYMSDLRVWNTKRTATEVNNNKNKRLVGNESGLIAYWPLQVPIGGGMLLTGI